MRESQTVLGWINEGKKEGRLEGRLVMAREALLAVLETLFAPLPPEWVERVNAVDDPDRLQAALTRALKLERLEDLTL